LYQEETHHEKKRIYLSSLLAIVGGLLIIALICAATIFPVFDDSKGSCIPSGGNWFCEELNLSIDFDNLTAILQSGDKTVVCQVIREHNSDYIVLEDKNTHSVLCAGECMDLSEMALEIEESETGRIYHFRKMEN